MVSNSKLKTSKKSGIYEIQCLNFQVIYIGQRGKGYDITIIETKKLQIQPVNIVFVNFSSSYFVFC